MFSYRVSAVIVTFNRLNWLKKVISAVENQSFLLDKIIIIDNCSTDGTKEWLQPLYNNFKFDIVHTKKNIGGAGGFSKGIELGMANGSDFLWIMDDDCIPETDALKNLIKSWVWFKKETPYEPGFMCSLVKFQDTDDICEMNIPNPIWDWTRYYQNSSSPVMLVKTCSFVSVLIHREKIKRVGLPYSEYFIWYDDVEYTRRLSKMYPGVCVLNSIARHFTPNNRGVNFSDVNDQNIWKFLYGARNEASFRFNHEGFNSWRKFSMRVNRQLHEGKVHIKNRALINKSLLQATRFNPKIKKV